MWRNKRSWFVSCCLHLKALLPRAVAPATVRLETFIVTRACNQLRTPRGRRVFRGGGNSLNYMSNSCKLCPTFFSSGAKKIPGVFAPLRPPLVTALLLRVACAPAVRQAENVPVFVAQKGHSHKKAIRTKLDGTAQFASMTAAWTSSKTLRNVSTDTSPRPRGSLVCARLQVSSNSSEVISTPMLLKIRLICKKQQGTNMQETIRWNCWKCSNCVLRDK